jgi:RNA polymerase sigma-B factor
MTETTADQDLGEDFGKLRELDPGDPAHQRLRDDIIRSQTPLVQGLAARFAGRGEPLEDLLQVGMVGLIKSVDRFDPAHGTPFTAYAVPTIVGEIKRHFRDRGWAIRPPRRIQELRAEAKYAQPRMAQRLGRAPTPSELAAEIGCSQDELTEAVIAGDSYNTSSLDRTFDDDPDEAALGERLGAEDDDLDFIELREAVKPALDKLPARERKILLLRFYGNKTQREIAAEFGISQMHVSRLISHSIAWLRGEVLGH